MTKLSDLMSLEDLEIELQNGFVRERKHPFQPDLTILNYTEKAQYEKHWNDVTTQCRGLIVSSFDHEVIARPWPKFFNLGEHTERMVLSTPVVAQDKMDGSLGILYRTRDGRYAISTRGSFESEQAIHATEVFLEQYDERFEPVEGLTYLFEIIYPGNRIVLNYGHIDDLVLLDVIDNETGSSVHLNPPSTWNAWGWPGAVVDRLPVATLGDALAMADRHNAEGMVLTYADGMKLKIKQEDYVRLHKIVTGLNERSIWEHLAENEGRLDHLLMVIPDEFHEWTQKVADTLLEQFEVVQGRAHDAYHHLVEDLSDWSMDDGLDERAYRAAFAEQAKTHGDLTGFLFQMLDGRDISVGIWKTLRPRGDTKSLLDRNEDNA